MKCFDVTAGHGCARYDVEECAPCVAVMSGFRMSGETGLGPREENETTVGAMVSLDASLTKMVAVGYLQETKTNNVWCMLYV